MLGASGLWEGVMRDPLGSPRLIFRNRDVKEHLPHHGRRASGRVESLRRPRQIFRADGTSWLDPGSVTIGYWDGTRQRRITCTPPSLYGLSLRPGQAVRIVYCPYHPAKIYRVVWPGP
jgi:hypothetical protein